MVKPEDLADGVRGDLPIIVQRLAHAPPHDGTRHLLEGILENSLIRLLARADLFIKPTHSNTPYSLVTNFVYAPPSAINSACVPRSTTLP